MVDQESLHGAEKGLGETSEQAEMSEIVEIGKIYENPLDDPMVEQTEKEITRDTNNDSEVQEAMASVKASGIDGYSSVWNRVFNRINTQRWDGFIRSYPEKARAYRGKVTGIDEAFGREER